MLEYYKCEKCAIGDVFFWHKKKMLVTYLLQHIKYIISNYLFFLVCAKQTRPQWHIIHKYDSQYQGKHNLF